MKKKKNIEFGHDAAKLTVLVDTPKPPPPAGFTSPFKSIQEWLFHLCDTNTPEKSISEYHFILIESRSDNLLSLYGFNTYDIDENVIAHRIDFEPATNMFFTLPKEEFGNLSLQRIKERILNELIKFTTSSKFKNSFFAKAKSLRTNFGAEIWSG